MIIYLLLIVFIFIVFLIDNSKISEIEKDNRANLLLRLVFFVLFLICALRSSSVGRDMPGYERVYDMTKSIDWNNYSYVYFENGYKFLMKVCIAFGFSFQMFMAICYVIILVPLYIFIKKYSNNKILSAFIFVCYMFFEFDLTGLRQAIAMSISIIGFMILLSNMKRKLVYYILIIFLASLFHKSAFICYLILPFLFIKSVIVYSIFLLLGSVTSLFLRRYLFVLIKEFFEKDSFTVDAKFYIGLNFIFLLILAVFFVYVQFTTKTKQSKESLKNWEIIDNIQTDDLLLKLYLLSIVIALFFGSETSARSYMYYNYTIILLLPNCILKFAKNKHLQYDFFLVLFLIVFFVRYTLLGSNFDIVPYRFFWQ